MKPPQRDFEQVPVDDFVNATIADVIYDEHHEFKKFQSDEKEVGWGVQLVLEISGLSHPKKTKWYRFSYDKKSNLYKLFVEPLVENAHPYMEFDLDNLKGMAIKMLWKFDKDPRYQTIETVRPYGKKIGYTPTGPQPVFKESHASAEVAENDDEVPF